VLVESYMRGACAASFPCVPPTISSSGRKQPHPWRKPPAICPRSMRGSQRANNRAESTRNIRVSPVMCPRDLRNCCSKAEVEDNGCQISGRRAIPVGSAESVITRRGEGNARRVGVRELIRHS